MSKIEGEIAKGVWHVIATRPSKVDGAGWCLLDNAIMSIDAAKEEHDAGRIDMAQGRDDNTFYLKVMFRRKPDQKRTPWFFRKESEHDAPVKRMVNYVGGSRLPRRRAVPQAQI